MEGGSDIGTAPKKEQHFIPLLIPILVRFSQLDSGSRKAGTWSLGISCPLSLCSRP